MTIMRKEIAPIFLLIIIFALAYFMWNFQVQTIEAQKQTTDLQNQLTYYENSSRTLQTQVNDLEAQLHDLQNPMYNVTIENISSDPWYVPVGVAMFKQISATIKNVGVRDVGGLTFEGKILANGTVWNNEYYQVVMGTSPNQIGVLHVGESIVVEAEIRSSLGVSFAGKTFAITVMFDGTVLSEGALSLSAGFPEP
ncbi:MAG: hypothetical protein ACM3WQ_06600 [Chloroflexota bacterium]